MAVQSLSRSSITTMNKYSSMLAGNSAFYPGDFESIATAVGTGSSGTITFSSIPATYTHLQLRFVGFQSNPGDVLMKVNTNVGLRDHVLNGTGSAVNSGTDAATANGLYISNFGFASTNPTVGIIDILDYANTNKYKTYRLLGGRDENGSGRVWLYSGLFDTTSAISSITITALTYNLTTSAHFALYGIKAA